MTQIIAFRLIAEFADTLRAAAKVRGIPISALIREAIAREIKFPLGREAAHDRH